MRSNLRAIMARLDRMQADAERRMDGRDPAELVARLHEGRRRALLGLSQPLSEEQARAGGRDLRQILRASGGTATPE